MWCGPTGQSGTPAATTNNARWNAGYPIPGAGPGFACPGTPVTVVARTPEIVDLYVVRTDGSVWHAGRYHEQRAVECGLSDSRRGSGLRAPGHASDRGGAHARDRRSVCD